MAAATLATVSGSRKMTRNPETKRCLLASSTASRSPKPVSSTTEATT